MAKVYFSRYDNIKTYYTYLVNKSRKQDRLGFTKYIRMGIDYYLINAKNDFFLKERFINDNIKKHKTDIKKILLTLNINAIISTKQHVEPLKKSIGISMMYMMPGDVVDIFIMAKTQKELNNSVEKFHNYFKEKNIFWFKKSLRLPSYLNSYPEEEPIDQLKQDIEFIDYKNNVIYSYIDVKNMLMDYILVSRKKEDLVRMKLVI